jgi:hypothetical protein
MENTEGKQFWTVFISVPDQDAGPEPLNRPGVHVVGGINSQPHMELTARVLATSKEDALDAARREMGRAVWGKADAYLAIPDGSSQGLAARLQAAYLEAKWSWQHSEDYDERPEGKTRQDMAGAMHYAALAYADYLAMGGDGVDPGPTWLPMWE